MAKKTQKAIEGAFIELMSERSVDKITVMDVCELSGVSRSTFYYHYHDMLDLLESLLQADVDSLLASNFTLETWGETLAAASSFAMKNRAVILHIYEGLRHETLEGYLFDIATVVTERLVGIEARKYDNLTKKDIEDVVRVLSATFVGLSFDWIRKGLDEDGLERLASVERILNGFIHHSFKELSAR